MSQEIIIFECLVGHFTGSCKAIFANKWEGSLDHETFGVEFSDVTFPFLQIFLMSKIFSEFDPVNYIQDFY